ncbi:hypothetical protein WJX73_000839 [Symbiochloris irregularis]|uniref:Uncharacterized protein n=1 Tax=Symbiochloris irregularis TaxID=706552 RepID=A0AAW1NUN1_9CHLO
MRLGAVCPAWLRLALLLVLSWKVHASTQDLGGAQRLLLAEAEIQNEGAPQPAQAGGSESPFEPQISRHSATALGSSPLELQALSSQNASGTISNTAQAPSPNAALPSNTAAGQSHAHSSIQEEVQEAGLPQVELPKGLSEDFKRKEAAAAAAAGADSSFHDTEHPSKEDVMSAEAVQEHEKGYGAKLPPSVVELKDEADAAAAATNSAQQQQQLITPDRDVQYETPHEANVVPGAVFHEEDRGGRVKAMAQSMGSAMRSATGASVVSSVAVVGAIGVLVGVSVYYLRYMRGSALPLPSIIEVGKSIRASRYSRLRKQPDANWEGDWDNDNWDDPGTGRIGDHKHGPRWDEDF